MKYWLVYIGIPPLDSYNPPYIGYFQSAPSWANARLPTQSPGVTSAPSPGDGSMDLQRKRIMYKLWQTILMVNYMGKTVVNYCKIITKILSFYCGLIKAQLLVISSWLAPSVCHQKQQSRLLYALPRCGSTGAQHLFTRNSKNQENTINKCWITPPTNFECCFVRQRAWSCTLQHFGVDDLDSINENYRISRWLQTVHLNSKIQRLIDGDFNASPKKLDSEW